MRRQERHWLLTDQDARTYAVAMQNALRHIPITVTQKYVDFAAAFIVAAQMEIPRIYMSAELARARAAAMRGQRPAGTVFEFYPPGTPPPAAPAPPNPQQPPPGGAGANGAAGPAMGAHRNTSFDGSPAAAPAADMTYEPEPDIPRFGP
jgi:hypothetical protein